MDFSFHLRQGQHLLEKQDASSIKKALGHFKEANEMTEDGHIAKPKILYLLALGNLYIGQVEQSYKVAHKAKKNIDMAIESSILSFDNMRQTLGEGNIDDLINHIEERYPQVVMYIDPEDDDFDENDLDFSLVNGIYQTADKKEVKPQFSFDNLNEEVLFATFLGLARDEEELVYFDKLKGDVVCYVQGYFSSLIGDQSISNRQLLNKITNNAPFDHVDEDRYILIDRLLLTEFLAEYKNQTKGKEPFSSFTNFFSVEILEDFSNHTAISDLACSQYVLEKFHEFFNQKYQNRINELIDDYTNYFESTYHALAINWIKSKVLDGHINNQNNHSDLDLNFLFKSSDHIRYENGTHVSGPHGGAGRAVKVEPNINGGEGYTVTLFNLDGNHPVWQNNVQMAPKQMKIFKNEADKIVLRGYGYDAIGASFSDYGLTIKLKNGTVSGCVLHMHDRHVDIEYLP